MSPTPGGACAPATGCFSCRKSRVSESLIRNPPSPRNSVGGSTAGVPRTAAPVPDGRKLQFSSGPVQGQRAEVQLRTRPLAGGRRRAPRARLPPRGRESPPPFPRWTEGCLRGNGQDLVEGQFDLVLSLLRRFQRGGGGFRSERSRRAERGGKGIRLPTGAGTGTLVGGIPAPRKPRSKKPPPPGAGGRGSGSAVLEDDDAVPHFRHFTRAPFPLILDSSRRNRVWHV